MATNTTNYGFKKPDESDFYDVADQNKNWDLADEALKNLDTPTFEDYTGSTAVPSATDAIDQIKSKGKLGTLLSNIKAAFKGACLIGHIVNNCVTDNAGLPLSAAQGKVLKDLYTQLYSDLNATNNNLSNTNSRLDTSLSSSVLDYALTLPEGLHAVRFPGIGYTGTDLPKSSYVYSSATISVRSTGKIATVLLFGISKNCPLAVNSCEDGKWKGWDQYVTKNDLPIIGKFTNKKNKDIIKIGSVVKSRSVVCVFPRYNTLTTIRCIYPSLEISAGEDQFQLFAWDTNTQNDSTSTNLEGYYIVMPMLSK